MAKATPRLVEKVVTETVKDGVTLELSHDEARYVRAIIGNITHLPMRWCNINDSIYTALADAGYTYNNDGLANELFSAGLRASPK